MIESSKIIPTYVTLNPGGYARERNGRFKGGWAWILRCGSHEKRDSGSEPSRSEYRMELMATVNALKQLKYPCHVQIQTGCEYLADHARRLLRPRSSDLFVGDVHSGKGKNADLWAEFEKLSKTHALEIYWVGFRSHDSDCASARRIAQHASYIRS